jgi:uncharacterized membrane protein YphA (DoxX/SURF4 family)
MGDRILDFGLQYAGYGLEASLCLLLAWQGRWRRLKGLGLYVAGLFLLDGVLRSAALNYFGRASTQFAYFYWLTDVVLALGAFLVMCGFFRRACAREEKMWSFVRLLLVFVFILVFAVSALSLTRNYAHLYSRHPVFIVEFSQNLYFSCLILNTLLYLMIQQLAIDDDQLALLVCGMGIQFAGEAACFALFHLTSGQSYARAILSYSGPVCTLGMLSIWVYAIAMTPETVTACSQPRKDVALVEAVAD